MAMTRPPSLMYSFVNPFAEELGLTTNAFSRVVALYALVMVTCVALDTEPTVNCLVALVWPAAIVSEAGIGNAPGFVLLSAMTAPPEGAGPSRTTITMTFAPLTTGSGVTLKIETTGGVPAGATVN